MNKEQLLQIVAPCGKLCSSCADYYDGQIRKQADALHYAMKGYDGFLGTEKFYKGWKDFREFQKYLTKLSCASCKGCRAGGTCANKCQECVIPKCTKARGIAFCGECSEYPCDRSDIHNGSALRDWRERNDYIKENGVEAYYETYKNKQHYYQYCYDES